MLNTGNTLFLITARGGSKGIPDKNIKLLGNKPLLYYSIDIARELTTDEYICLSSDSIDIINSARKYGLEVPFVRPSELATDRIGTYDVLLHAVNYYEKCGQNLDTVVLLQPTSPFRKAWQLKEAMQSYSTNIDMVVSVCKSESNPYFNLYEEDPLGQFIELSKKAHFVRRQDTPNVYVLNGAIYVINIASLRKGPLSQFQRVVKYEMNSITSVDLDTMLDWHWAEFLLEKKLV